jgi:tetratricopeptide (TPR) repeat protein
MKGELAEGVVPNLLRELYVGRRTGTLTLVKTDEKQSLRVRRGHIVNAHTTVKTERLGETLVNRGLLTEDDFARATEVALQGNKRLGEAFLELGIMDESGLEDAVALHVHTLLAKVFTWDEGTYNFDEEEETPGELTLKLSTADLILEAVRAITDPDVVVYLLGDRDGVLALSSDPLLRFQQLKLSPTDGFVMSRVDGTMSAREIEGMIPLPPEEVQRSLLGLLSTGIIEFDDEARKPREEKTRAPSSATAPTPPSPPGDEGSSSPPPAAAAPAGAPPAAPHPRAEPPRSEPPAAAPPPEKPPPPVKEPAARPAAGKPPAAEPPAATPDKPPVEKPPAPPPTPTAQPSPPSEPPAAKPAPQAAAAPADETPAPVDEAAAERRREIDEAWDDRKTRTHFEVLGLARSATDADVKEAYFNLAKRFHPDVHHGASLGDLQDKLEAVFIRLGEAYGVLRDTDKRRDYEGWLGRPKPQTSEDGEPGSAEPDPEAEARQAEAAVVHAGALLKEEKYWDAIQKLEPLMERLTGTNRLRAQLILARCYLQNPKWVKTAKETLETAVRENPKSPVAYSLLAGLYKQLGLKTRAASTYRKVLELKPEDKEAAEALAGLGTQKEEPPPAPEGGGFLKKIFRR